MAPAEKKLLNFRGLRALLFDNPKKPKKLHFVIKKYRKNLKILYFDIKKHFKKLPERRIYMKKNHLEKAYFEKKTGWFRYKNPSVYSWRTSPNMLLMLKLMANKEERYKCEILEDAVKEYFERHFCDELAKSASGSQLAALYSDVYGL